MENWTLLNEVFKKENIKFDYIWGVRDGTRKGGAYRAVNMDSDIVSIMKDKKYWVYDYIETNKNKYTLKYIDRIRACRYGYGSEVRLVEIKKLENKTNPL